MKNINFPKKINKLAPNVPKYNSEANLNINLFHQIYFKILSFKINKGVSTYEA